MVDQGGTPISATVRADSGVRAALEQTMLFGALDGATLDQLVGASSRREFERGQPVLIGGDPGGDVLVVAEGRLHVLVRSPEGLDIVLAVAQGGDTLGEVSLFDRAPRAATVEAAERSVVVTVPGDAVRRVIRENADLAEEVMRQQSALIRRATGMVADLVFLDLPRRVAKYVVERLGDDGQVDLGMSQSGLAAAVGGVRQSVNAALRGFERRGWVRVDGRTVCVYDRAALAEYAMVELP